jgi:hypothetical protein
MEQLDHRDHKEYREIPDLRAYKDCRELPVLLAGISMETAYAMQQRKI